MYGCPAMNCTTSLKAGRPDNTPSFCWFDGVAPKMKSITHSLGKNDLTNN